MRIALSDPVSGYYMRRNPIAGDFITAPEISQIFGELIGLFFVQVWQDQGRPPNFRLLELGPGRGTLMADMLRAARIRPDFLHAARIELIEISPVLRELQQRAFAVRPVQWRESLDDVPMDMPLFILANEFFDALPVRQFVRVGPRWHERRIGLDGSLLCFLIDPEPAPAGTVPVTFGDAAEGQVYEYSESGRLLVTDIASRIAADGGAGLIIDYGHVRRGLADTFQAVRAHRFADPLDAPGETDLTCHVDFPALAEAARTGGARVFGPVTQDAFLTRLGICERAEVLKRNAPESADEIDSGVERLIGEAQMGALFKVLGLSRRDAPPLPGFVPC